MDHLGQDLELIGDLGHGVLHVVQAFALLRHFVRRAPGLVQFVLAPAGDILRHH